MGLNLGVNAITSSGLGIAVILLIVMGILLWTAQDKVKQLEGLLSSSSIDRISNDLRTASILTFIAAAVCLILVVAYAGHETLWSPSEWIHTALYIVLLALMVIAVIYAYVALKDLYQPTLDNKNGADIYIWASFIVAVFAFLAITATATGRVGFNSVRDHATKRLNLAEKKLHETHSAITGHPVEYPVDTDKYDMVDGEITVSGSLSKQHAPVVAQPVMASQPVTNQPVASTHIYHPQVPTSPTARPAVSAHLYSNAEGVPVYSQPELGASQYMVPPQRIMAPELPPINYLQNQ